jgi:Tfp pilus assembly ATPase PilU
MQTMNQALATLVLRRQIALEEALGRTTDVVELQQVLDAARQSATASRS